MNTQSNSRSVENLAIAIIGAVQFVNIVDFMMVLPLGPDFAKALGIRVSHMGVLAGAYTLAAALSGFVGSFFLDRLDRKKALVGSILGLSIGTAAGAFAVDFHTLLWARVLAGIFGGPTASIGLAIISDLVPHERRGAAIGKVMIGFSAASIFGVPIGLEIAGALGWNAPFLVVGGAAMLMMILAQVFMPPMRDHLKGPVTQDWFSTFQSLLTNKKVLTSFFLLFCVMVSGFLIFPNISGYVQINLQFPRESMGQLYFIGGLASLVTMTLSGKLIDKMGAVPWFLIGSLGFMIGLMGGLYSVPPWVNPYALFIIFMAFGTLRNISTQTLSSKVPRPNERAGYMSLQSCVQHGAMSVGGIASSRILSTDDTGALIGMSQVVICSGVVVVLAVILVNMLARQVRAHEH